LSVGSERRQRVAPVRRIDVDGAAVAGAVAGLADVAGDLGERAFVDVVDEALTESLDRLRRG
jgi:hypothetical protein